MYGERVCGVNEHHTAVALVMVEGTCDHCNSTNVLGGSLEESASEAEVAVTLAHDGLALGKALNGKLVLAQNPVLVFALTAVIDDFVVVVCKHIYTLSQLSESTFSRNFSYAAFASRMGATSRSMGQIPSPLLLEIAIAVME